MHVPVNNNNHSERILSVIYPHITCFLFFAGLLEDWSFFLFLAVSFSSCSSLLPFGSPSESILASESNSKSSLLPLPFATKSESSAQRKIMCNRVNLLSNQKERESERTNRVYIYNYIG